MAATLTTDAIRTLGADAREQRVDKVARVRDRLLSGNGWQLATPGNVYAEDLQKRQSGCARSCSEAGTTNEKPAAQWREEGITR